jgi:dihydropteroate synthase
MITERPEFTVPCRPHPLVLGKKTLLMGIVNVTPDSFSDGGKFFHVDAAVKQALSLEEDGADILDFGAESTRPGSDSVDADEEIRRVVPVIEALRAETRLPISIDTSKAVVADAALKAGANIVNDVTGFQGDQDMASVTAAHGAAAVLMHIRGSPKTMNVDTNYEDLIGEVCGYLQESIEIGIRAGVQEEAVIIDPGIGFAKRHRQNLELLHHLEEFQRLNQPILVGPSRKSFIGHMTGLLPEERIFGTAASVALCACKGAHILRVHDVKEMRQVLEVTDGVRCPELADEV